MQHICLFTYVYYMYYLSIYIYLYIYISVRACVRACARVYVCGSSFLEQLCEVCYKAPISAPSLQVLPRIHGEMRTVWANPLTLGV